MPRFVVTGTDTGIGKTVFSAALAGALRAHYWKPVQSGLDDGADRDAVASLAQLPPERVLPEAYRLTEPLSPHRAAELDGIQIDPARLSRPISIRWWWKARAARWCRSPATRSMPISLPGGTCRSSSWRARGLARSTTAC
jgi:hypothetical protein